MTMARLALSHHACCLPLFPCPLAGMSVFGIAIADVLQCDSVMGVTKAMSCPSKLAAEGSF